MANFPCEICGWGHPEGGEHVWERKPDYEVDDEFVRVDKRTKEWKERKVSEVVEKSEEAAHEEIDGAERRMKGIKAGAERREAWRVKAMAEYQKKFGETK